MVHIYGLRACDTCRKAVKSLEAAGHDTRFSDVRDTPLDAETRVRFAEAFGDAIVNRRSTTWRGLSEAERALPPADLIAAHPTVMKRPVIVDGDALLLGWTPEVQARFGVG